MGNRKTTKGSGRRAPNLPSSNSKRHRRQQSDKLMLPPSPQLSRTADGPDGTEGPGPSIVEPSNIVIKSYKHGRFGTSYDDISAFDYTSRRIESGQEEGQEDEKIT